MSNNDWTTEQRRLVYHLYCQLPFGRLHGRNPEVIELGKLIGRTPGAVAMKLTNLASLDPKITDTGRRGLRGSSKADGAFWSSFNEDWESFAIECEETKRRLRAAHGLAIDGTPQPKTDVELADTFVGETKEVVTEYRIKQRFFRRVVTSSYGMQCCMSSVCEPRLLVASHIVPWSKDKGNRINPANGLCLSAMHDRAFDAGLITVTPEYAIRVSPKLKKYEENELIRTALLELSGKSIRTPRRFKPSPELLARHNRFFEAAQWPA